eukprot:TRINITY_DN31031_c0_g1_i2.p2 TRINITY_DN31031_c0_g1~~TRINITY_DN31031_c0_g1_i2.p2  ORF type:complete len:101 (-),score=2.90 TRINITY_DN31031_c0_g1_i2:91-393(-)
MIKTITNLIQEREKVIEWRKKGVSVGEKKLLGLVPEVELERAIVQMRPPIVTGFIYKVGHYLGGCYLRFLELNPITACLRKFNKREHWPDHPKQIFPLIE